MHMVIFFFSNSFFFMHVNWDFSSLMRDWKENMFFCENVCYVKKTNKQTNKKQNKKHFPQSTPTTHHRNDNVNSNKGDNIFGNNLKYALEYSHYDIPGQSLWIGLSGDNWIQFAIGHVILLPLIQTIQILKTWNCFHVE